MAEKSRMQLLIEELVTISGPQAVQLGLRGGESAVDWQVARERWERRAKALCAQIYFQGHGAGWDKHVAVVELKKAERDQERAHGG